MLDLSPQLLNWTGIAFALLGSAILFIDLQGDDTQRKVRELLAYNRAVEKSGKGIVVGPRGKPKDGELDLADIEQLMADAVDGAIERNKDLHVQVLEQMDEAADRHRRARNFAIFLVLVGGLLQLVGAVLAK